MQYKILLNLLLNDKKKFLTFVGMNRCVFQSAFLSR